MIDDNKNHEINMFELYHCLKIDIYNYYECYVEQNLRIKYIDIVVVINYYKEYCYPVIEHNVLYMVVLNGCFEPMTTIMKQIFHNILMPNLSQLCQVILVKRRY